MSRHVVLLGKPVAESLSPRMQNAAFAAAGLDWEYVAREVGVDRLALEHEPRRQPAEDRHERGPVRLAGGRERQRHASKPRALRIASTGAGRPVQRSKEAAPWRTSAS